MKLNFILFTIVGIFLRCSSDTSPMPVPQTPPPMAPPTDPTLYCYQVQDGKSEDEVVESDKECNRTRSNAIEQARASTKICLESRSTSCVGKVYVLKESLREEVLTITNNGETWATD